MKKFNYVLLIIKTIWRPQPWIYELGVDRIPLQENQGHPVSSVGLFLSSSHLLLHLSLDTHLQSTSNAGFESLNLNTLLIL